MTSKRSVNKSPQKKSPSTLMLFVRGLPTAARSFGASFAHSTYPTQALRFAQPKRFTSRAVSSMAQPKYLTGDKAGIEAFIDQFDVSALELIFEDLY